MDLIYGHIKFITLVVIIIGTTIICTETIDKKDNTQSIEITYNNLNTEEIKISEELYITNYCIARDIPNKKGNKVTEFNRGDVIRTLSIIDNSWYKIEYNNEYIYIQKIYTANKKDMFIDSNNIQIIPVQEDKDKVIIYDNSIETENINYAYNYWYLLPENIQNKFKDNNWNIVLTNENLEDKFNIDYDIIAITIPNNDNSGTIYIENRQSAIRKAFLHEIGHFIDVSLNFISNTEEFNTVYNEEGNVYLKSDKFKNNYNKQEFFAEAFSSLIIDEANTEITLPITYKYILNILKNF